MPKRVVSKEKMRLINQRAYRLSQDIYARYRLEMIEAAAKEENFNPDKWQPKEDRNDSF